ncbi:MAG TPA: Gfo/Idh/MocA family oxidoreductase [Bauldia sp.]|nr:Gfo/Idh/MocA family oxidoreductase [Bauldia sp.]
MASSDVRFALIGAGFIGRIHGLALQAVNGVFGAAPLRAVSAVLADENAGLAERQAGQLGFARWTTDWRDALADVDAVVIAAPSFMHREIALAALAAGKHVLCEKPVGRSSAEADDVAAAARKAGVTTAVGFTYMRAPMVAHAIALVQSGALGRPVSFRGRHAEDYLADPEAPFSWRLDASLAGRSGALGDLGWHIIAIARALCGPVASLSGLSEHVHPSRRTAAGAETRRTVENEDWAGALVRFGSGAVGTVEASRVAHGRKMDIGFELTLEHGTIAFDGERTNELQVYRHGGAAGAQGFQTIRIDGGHKDYGAFLPAPAHGLGFNDLKTIELHDFLVAIAEGRSLDPDLEAACRIARVCEAILDSSASGRRIDAPEAAGTRMAKDRVSA